MTNSGLGLVVGPAADILEAIPPRGSLNVHSEGH